MSSEPPSSVLGFAMLVLLIMSWCVLMSWKQSANYFACHQNSDVCVQIAALTQNDTISKVTYRASTRSKHINKGC
eukprot:4971151-Amphidinium_carterae.1